MRKTTTILLVAISAVLGSMVGRYMEHHGTIATIAGCLYGGQANAAHGDDRHSGATRGWL